jgi:SAM-dependent methyltransferase
MPSVRDERGYNQGWSGTAVLELREERRCALLVSKMTPGETQRVLEIGCGRGAMARQLARATGMQVLGVDISKQFIEQAQESATEDNVRFAVVDLARPEGLMGERFDYIIGNGILHHLDQELHGSLARFRGMLNEGGRLVFLEPNVHNPYVYLIFSRPRLRARAKLEPDEMAFSKAFITERLRTAGFTDVEVEYRDFLVPGTPRWLVRPVVGFGRLAEATPGLKHLAQSLLISAKAG